MIAVEVELNGKFCYWIGAVRVGAYDEGTSLRDVLFQLPTVLRDRGRRTHATLFELGGDAVYARLHGALFGPETTADEKTAIEEEWARFNVKVPIDVLDQCAVFVVERPPRTRIIFATDSGGRVQEAELRAGEVDDVLLKVYRGLDTLHRREMKFE